MHDYKTVIGVIAGILAFIAFIPYIVSILKGKTKPNRATFAIWSAVNVVTVASYIASGARTTIFTGLVYATMQLVIFGLSFKYGVGGYSKLDIICLIGAAVGITAWVLTKNPQTALYISIFVEALGFLPTIKKAYLHPHTEDTLAWSIAVVASTLNLFALNSLQFAIVIYPVYNLIGDLLVDLPLIFPTFRPLFKKTD